MGICWLEMAIRVEPALSLPKGRRIPSTYTLMGMENNKKINRRSRERPTVRYEPPDIETGGKMS